MIIPLQKLRCDETSDTANLALTTAQVESLINNNIAEPTNVTTANKGSITPTKFQLQCEI